ncbi:MULTISPECIES: polymorphic toxin-type HINT domain-containing protein [Cysteiniphilum]|uniref:polymorphic toxin-type HINT domain-containing protein n=1 Tax=Cysteiniphilum TaxID=2056696 RepID=UPI00177DC833|nr:MULTISPECIES: polymorphic toxin-type HINT domain-containing protein [Cysteiniphilum]
MRKYFISILFLTLPLISSAHNYDAVNITPRLWQQVTLNYTDMIDGRSYPAEIKLLRHSQWLKESGIDQVGRRSVFSLPEFGIDQVQVTVTDINDIKVDTKDTDRRKEKTKTVTGTFKRYAKDVRTYAFKDEKGNIEQINATPNHPFYVVNQQAYVAIDDITINDNLISQSGNIVKLVCVKGKMLSCGKPYSQTQSPTIVYNIEVYQEHVYQVGLSSVLTHNVYGSGAKKWASASTPRGLSYPPNGKPIPPSIGASKYGQDSILSEPRVDLVEGKWPGAKGTLKGSDGEVDRLLSESIQPDPTPWPNAVGTYGVEDEISSSVIRRPLYRKNVTHGKRINTRYRATLERVPREFEFSEGDQVVQSNCFTGWFKCLFK